jgi:hypothetical protein
MGDFISSLSAKLGANVANTDVFLIANSSGTSNNSITVQELSNMITGITARNTAGLTLFGKTSQSGIKIDDNGYVGIMNPSPTVSLDIGDIGNNGSGQVRISAATSSRTISYNLRSTGDSAYYRLEKRGSDTKGYLSYSTNGTSFTPSFVFDTGGFAAIGNWVGTIPAKLFVTGGNAQFTSGAYGITLVPSNAEIQSTTSSDILYLNYSNNNNVVLGANALTIDNTAGAPKVGYNTATPLYAFHINSSGVGIAYLNSVNSNSSFLIGNSAYSGYFNVNTSYITFGSDATLSSNNVVYDITNKRLGFGDTSPDAKLHILSADTTNTKLENTANTTTCELLIANNYAAGPARHSLVSFSRYDGAIDQKKWALGNFSNTSGPLTDVIAFVQSADPATNSNVKGYLDTNGNFAVQGGYYSFPSTGITSTDYCKGKFVQHYKTTLESITGTGFFAVTGQAYIDPFGVSKASARSSGNGFQECPFGIAPYDGKVVSIQIMTSASAASLTPHTYYLEFFAASGSGTTAGFTSIPAIATGSPRSPYIQFTSGSLYQNRVTNFTSFTVGNPTFAANNLLQYRLYWASGNNVVTPVNIPINISSVLSYTVT